MPSTQDDDEPTKQRQIQQPVLSSEPLTTWIPPPQSSTNQYAIFQNLEFEPRHGQEQDSLHIKLQLEKIECLPLLKIAFGSCIMPTQSFLDPTTNITHLSSTVPSWSLTQSSNRSIPLYITVISDQPNSISVLDAWLIGYFTYQPNKRSSAELPLSYETLMKRTKPSNIGNNDYIYIYIRVYVYVYVYVCIIIKLKCNIKKW